MIILANTDGRALEWFNSGDPYDDRDSALAFAHSDAHRVREESGDSEAEQRLRWTLTSFEGLPGVTEVAASIPHNGHRVAEYVITELPAPEQ